METIVVVGSSGHAKVVLDILRCEGKYAIAGLIDSFRPAGEQILGYPVLGREEDLPRWIAAKDLRGIVVAIGDNFVRANVAGRIREIAPGLPFVSAVHPKACVAGDVSLGAGTVIMAGGAINPGARVGRCCIINTNASLDHDSTLDDFASLAPAVAVGGNCQIGAYAAIGIGASLRHGIEVGEHAVIGAGSVVVRPIPPFAVAYGVPAKPIRTRTPGEKYL